jgi:hypothetical protein
MSYTYGLTQSVTIQTAGQIGSGLYPVRVFDVVSAITGCAASIHNVSLTGTTSTTATIINGYIILDKSRPVFNSNAGILFPAGAFAKCSATGTTLFVNFIEER